MRTHTRFKHKPLQILTDAHTHAPMHTHKHTDAHTRTLTNAQTHIASDGLQQLFSVAVDAPTLVVVNLLVTNQQTVIEVRMCL